MFFFFMKLMRNTKKIFGTQKRIKDRQKGKTREKCKEKCKTQKWYDTKTKLK